MGGRGVRERKEKQNRRKGGGGGGKEGRGGEDGKRVNRWERTQRDGRGRAGIFSAAAVLIGRRRRPSSPLSHARISIHGGALKTVMNILYTHTHTQRRTPHLTSHTAADYVTAPEFTHRHTHSLYT